MLGMIKMLPIVILLAGAGYAYHTTVVSQKDAVIARLEANAVTLKENAMRLETAFEREQAARERSEQNLQSQLKAVGDLTEKNNAMQQEMDGYLSIFKRHDMTRLARAKLNKTTRNGWSTDRESKCIASRNGRLFVNF